MSAIILLIIVSFQAVPVPAGLSNVWKSFIYSNKCQECTILNLEKYDTVEMRCHIMLALYF